MSKSSPGGQEKYRPEVLLAQLYQPPHWESLYVPLFPALEQKQEASSLPHSFFASSALLL